MPAFGKRSRVALATCHDDLRRVAASAILVMDFSVLEGHRSNARQAELFAKRLSKARPGESKHNRTPSEAFDIAPYPIDWEDTGRFIYFAGRMIEIARGLGVELRWGGDWNGDTLLTERFKDLGHFEILRPHTNGRQRPKK